MRIIGSSSFPIFLVYSVASPIKFGNKEMLPQERLLAKQYSPLLLKFVIMAIHGASLFKQSELLKHILDQLL